MAQEPLTDAEQVETFVRSVTSDRAPGSVEVTGQGTAGCELTFTTSYLNMDLLNDLASEAGMVLDGVDFENRRLRYFVADR